MAGAANVMIKIGANASDAVGEIRKVNKALGDQMTASQRASSGIRKAAVPAALALAALGAVAIDAAKAAAADEEAQVKLAGALRRSTGATDEAIKSAEAYIDKLAFATGVADDELRPALAKLATATGSVTEAQDGLKVALDVSAATGKNLDSVSKALAKAYAGNGAALAKLIPGIDQAAIKSGDFATINRELARLTGGAAAEAANTAAGQYRIFQLTLDETKESIGAALLPVLKQLAPILQTVAKLVYNNTDAVVALGAAVAAIAAAITAANVALKLYEAGSLAVKVATAAWTAAQWLLNAALTANPIGLVVVAIAALVAGLILAYQKSGTFREIVDKVAETLKNVGQAALKPFIENWDSISRAIGWALDKAREFWPILLPGGALYLGLKEIYERFDVVRDIVGAVRSAFSTIIGVVDSLWRAFSRVVTAIREVLDLLGRLPNLGSLGGLLDRSVSTRAAATSFGVTGGSIINVTINGPIDADSTARELLNVLDRYDRRYGLQIA
jgi:hypothetical protein